MGELPAGEEEAASRRQARANLRRHALAFVVVQAALIAINAVIGPPWWATWPLLAWGVVLGAHWLYVKSTQVDEAWVEERTIDVRHAAYDLGHIENIERRYERQAKAKASRDPSDGTPQSQD